MEELLFGLFGEVLYVLLSIAVLYGIRFIGKRLREHEVELLKQIVEDGVLFAQQVSGHLDGEERYNTAIQYIVDTLSKKKIKITDEQLKGLVESILKRLKLEYGDKW